MAPQTFKVVIVGGSVAGLTLAKMLEKIGVDFVLLEGHDQVAPQVGASIGLLANGLRILDQLGCFEELCRRAPHSLQSVILRSEKSVLTRHSDLDPLIKGKFGYPFDFMERQTLLQVLFDNLAEESKAKVLTGKKVVGVDLFTGGIKATAQDGTEYTGDIIVGADGVHSTVRREMWSLAAKMKPGYFSPQPIDEMRSEYCCIFGISNPVGWWKGGDAANIFRDGFSYFIVGGPEGCIYWFLFMSLGGVKVGKDIPRFTDDDKQRIAAEHWDDIVDDGVTFGDLYTRQKVTVLTALQEVVFKKWHFRRIMTIGDAAHKLHPLGAQGGNSAIETAACLANGIHRGLGEGNAWTEGQLDELFSQVTAQRRDNLVALMNRAHLRQRIESLDGPLLKFSGLYILPRLPSHGIFRRLYTDTYAGIRLDMLPVPKRHRLALFRDELPKPRGNGTRIWQRCAVLLLALAAVVQHSSLSGLGEGAFPEKWPMILWIMTLLPIWISHRVFGSQPSAASYLTAFLLLCQRYGFSVIVPLLYVVDIRSSRNGRAMLSFRSDQASPDLEILFRTTIGLALPAAWSLLSLRTVSHPGPVTVLHGCWPLYAGAVAFSSQWLVGSPPTANHCAERVKRHGLSQNKGYVLALALSTAVHILASLLAWRSLFLGISTAHPASLSLPLGLSGNQLQAALFAVETHVWLVTRGLTLYQAGLLNANWAQVVVGITIGLVVLGPASMTTLLWWFQDRLLLEYVHG